MPLSVGPLLFPYVQELSEHKKYVLQIGNNMKDNDSFTKLMGIREYIRYSVFKRHMANRVMDMLAATSIPFDDDIRALTRMSFDALSCLHDDLVRMASVPYAISAFTNRLLQIETKRA